VLVTISIGTLLGGSPEKPPKLYGWLAVNAQEVCIYFLYRSGPSGRCRAMTGWLEFSRRPPAPHLVIGDCGCTVPVPQPGKRVPMAVDPIRGPVGRLWPLCVDGCLGRVAGPQSPRPSPRAPLRFNYEPETFVPHFSPAWRSLGVIASSR